MRCGFGVENERLKTEVRQCNYEINKLKEEITEMNEREIKDVYAYRNLDDRKKTLSKEVEKLERDKAKLSIDKKVLKQFVENYIGEGKKIKGEIETFEKQKKELKKRLKRYGKLDKKKIKVHSFKARRLLFRLNVAGLLINKKPQKAKRQLKKAREKLTMAVLPEDEKQLLRLRLCELEAKLK